MIYAIISIIAVLVSIAGYCNGIMDFIKFRGLDKAQWKNKWELDENGKLKPARYYWYYFGLFVPEHEESFPYSSTILVFITDKWHLKKWCMFLCYEIALSCVVVHYEGLQWWYIPIGIAILKTFRGLGFTLKYDKK